MNAIEHAVALPPDEVVVHRATRRKILRNIAPLTTGAQDVHQAVHHRTHVGAALAAARPRRRNERRNNRPLLVREVAWVPQMITIVSRSVFLRPHRQPPANQTASFQSQMIPVTPEVSRRTLSPLSLVCPASATLLAFFLELFFSSGNCRVPGIFPSNILPLSFYERSIVRIACNALAYWFLMSWQSPRLPRTGESERGDCLRSTWQASEKVLREVRQDQ